MGVFVEIDHRANGGVDVSLLWDPAADALYVQLIDWGMDEDYTFGVAREDAFDAFQHPFAYASRVSWDDMPPDPPSPTLASAGSQAGSR
jgi:hypothetical protein